jgi:ketosteroid isomerase-like protein
LVATNVVDGNVYTIRGAVVCEAREGKIIRLAAYPDAGEMTAFLNALETALAARA